MSGHSKWSQIKRQKGVADAKRGQMFTKLGREIAVAVRAGGPNPEVNPRLRLAIDRARLANMPIDTIERAIKRAAGSAAEGNLDEIVYEGYGPGGAALLIEVLTDNRKRAVAEVRSAFTRAGGSLAESGAVAWLFEQRGVLTIEAPGVDPDEIGLRAIDAGATDVRTEGGVIEVYTDPAELDDVRTALVDSQLEITAAEVAMVPRATVALDADRTVSILRLMERLEDMDDVQKVYTNIEISDEAVAAYAGV
ncbi:MAG: YebC/PmpR family DNA-binding transcriptional regulator [Chloroflexi bacterium]|nr:YebC/PmpR family DNA-binding transcriptional regulator [Chloroflexota bacterium]